MSKTKPKTPTVEVLDALQAQYNDPLQDNTFTNKYLTETTSITQQQVGIIIKHMRKGNIDGVKIDKWGSAPRYTIKTLDPEDTPQRLVIDNALCKQLRTEMATHTNLNTIDETYDFARGTLKNHLLGECPCENNSPTFTFEGRGDSGEWVKHE